MIDINNSQDYDDDTLEEIVAEEVYRSSGLGSLANNPFPSYLQEYFAKTEAKDRGNRELTDPIEFMRLTYPGQRLSRFILTHPDLDHMRGLKRLYETVGFDRFWDTANIRSQPSFGGDADRIDWDFYQRLRLCPLATVIYQGGPDPAFGGLMGLGDDIEVLSPTQHTTTRCNVGGTFNDISIVSRVRFGGRSIVFPGDAEQLAWSELVSRYGYTLKADFLKASHHGRDTGYHMEAARHIAPEITFVSVGKKPATDASSKYRNFCKQVVSTRFYGNIELIIQADGSWQCNAQRNGGK